MMVEWLWAPASSEQDPGIGPVPFRRAKRQNDAAEIGPVPNPRERTSGNRPVPPRNHGNQICPCKRDMVCLCSSSETQMANGLGSGGSDLSPIHGNSSQEIDLPESRS